MDKKNTGFPRSDLTAEQQAALLKTREKPLGKVGDPIEGGEMVPIAWETGINPEPIPASDTKPNVAGISTIANANVDSAAYAPAGPERTFHTDDTPSPQCEPGIPPQVLTQTGTVAPVLGSVGPLTHVDLDVSGPWVVTPSNQPPVTQPPIHVDPPQPSLPHPTLPPVVTPPQQPPVSQPPLHVDPPKPPVVQPPLPHVVTPPQQPPVNQPPLHVDPPQPPLPHPTLPPVVTPPHQPPVSQPPLHVDPPQPPLPHPTLPPVVTPPQQPPVSQPPLHVDPPQPPLPQPTLPPVVTPPQQPPVSQPPLHVDPPQPPLLHPTLPPVVTPPQQPPVSQPPLHVDPPQPPLPQPTLPPVVTPPQQPPVSQPPAHVDVPQPPLLHPTLPPVVTPPQQPPVSQPPLHVDPPQPPLPQPTLPPVVTPPQQPPVSQPPLHVDPPQPPLLQPTLPPLVTPPQQPPVSQPPVHVDPPQPPLPQPTLPPVVTPPQQPPVSQPPAHVDVSQPPLVQPTLPPVVTPPQQPPLNQPTLHVDPPKPPVVQPPLPHVVTPPQQPPVNQPPVHVDPPQPPLPHPTLPPVVTPPQQPPVSQPPLHVDPPQPQLPQPTLPPVVTPTQQPPVSQPPVHVDVPQPPLVQPQLPQVVTPPQQPPVSQPPVHVDPPQPPLPQPTLPPVVTPPQQPPVSQPPVHVDPPQPPLPQPTLPPVVTPPQQPPVSQPPVHVDPPQPPLPQPTLPPVVTPPQQPPVSQPPTHVDVPQPPLLQPTLPPVVTPPPQPPVSQPPVHVDPPQPPLPHPTLPPVVTPPQQPPVSQPPAHVDVSQPPLVQPTLPPVVTPPQQPPVSQPPVHVDPPQPPLPQPTLPPVVTPPNQPPVSQPPLHVDPPQPPLPQPTLPQVVTPPQQPPVSQPPAHVDVPQPPLPQPTLPPVVTPPNQPPVSQPPVHVDPPQPPLPQPTLPPVVTPPQQPPVSQPPAHVDVHQPPLPQPTLPPVVTPPQQPPVSQPPVHVDPPQPPLPQPTLPPVVTPPQQPPVSQPPLHVDPPQPPLLQPTLPPVVTPPQQPPVSQPPLHVDPPQPPLPQPTLPPVVTPPQQPPVNQPPAHVDVPQPPLPQPTLPPVVTPPNQPPVSQPPVHVDPPQPPLLQPTLPPVVTPPQQPLVSQPPVHVDVPQPPLLQPTLPPVVTPPQQPLVSQPPVQVDPPQPPLPQPTLPPVVTPPQQPPVSQPPIHVNPPEPPLVHPPLHSDTVIEPPIVEAVVQLDIRPPPLPQPSLPPVTTTPQEPPVAHPPVHIDPPQPPHPQPALFVGADKGSLIEDNNVSAGRISTSGTLKVLDPDPGQGHLQAQKNSQGTYGVFSVDTSGHWTYSATNSDLAIQALKAGDALNDRFTVTSADGTQHTVSVTIQGTNDAPTLIAQSHSLIEDGARVAGQMAAGDIDRCDSKTFRIAAPIAGLTFQTDGSYTFDPSDGAYQHLAAGQTETLTVPVTVTDSAGATATQNLSITLTGTNDTPTIGGVSTAAVTEDKNVTGGRLETGGQLTITDVDTGQDHFEVQINKPGAYGTFSVDASGYWTYTADNAQTNVQSLNVGEALTDHLLVRSADGTQHTVSVTIQGTNDAPTLTAQSHSVVEDGARVAGQMVATDVDRGDTRSFSISNPVAGLTFHPDGSYSFDPSDGAYQHLAAGQTQTLTVPVTVTDSAGATATQNLTITLTGTNDTPTIAGVNTAAVTEDKNVTGGRLETGGQLTITDVDTGQDHFEVQINKSVAYGTFSVDASGHWTYTADNAQTKVQSLNVGEALTDQLLVRSADGTLHTVSVTIQGTNDAPTLTAQTHAVTEDGARLTGQMLAQDADAHDAHTFSIGSSVPGLNLTRDGRFAFDPADASYQHLAAGQTQTLVIPVTVTDRAGATATHNLSITVTGANDGAVIAGVSHGATFEDSANLVNGKLTVQDVDTGEAAFQPYSGIGVFGIFGLKDDGTWSYQINNSKPEVQALAAGQTATETFTVHSIDGTSQQVTVTIEGKNDTAVIGGVSSGQVKEDTTLHTNGRLTISDADSGQAAFRPGNVAGTYGTLHLTADGQWTYDLNNNARGVQSLAKDGLVTDTLAVTSVDGTTHQVKIAVSGTNDVPVISGTSTGSLVEDNSRHTVSQVLRSTDVDTGDTATWALLGSGQGTYGQLNFDPGTQRWTYTLDNTDVDTNALSAGQHVSEIFQVRVTDSNGATATKDIRVNITGSNDAPTITGTATGTVVESDPSHATVGGTLAHADVDTGDTFHWSLANGRGTYGNLHFDVATGNWLYSLDESKTATQALNAGQTVTETFTVTGQDKAGARVTQSIKVQVQGSNDNPVISGAHEGAVVEDRTLVANGALTSADVDSGDKAASWQVLAPHGTYGSLSIDASGRWTYSLDPALSQTLRAGTTVDESFVVRVTDQHGGTSEQTVTLHVTGSNDTPKINASQSSLQGEVTEDRLGFTSTGGTIGSGDPDVGDRLSWSIAGGSASSLDGRYGTFSLGADGHWTYTLDHGKANGLAESATATETFNVHVTDGAGERSSAVVTVRIHGSNDSPAIGGQTTGDVTEDVAPSARGALSSGDPDHPDSAQWEIIGNGLGQYGSLVLDQGGHWTYSLAQSPNVQALGDGESVIETFGVKVTDSQGAESTQQITVHVHGNNDAPTIAGTTTGQVAEDVLNTVSGQLTAQDVDRGDHAHFQTATFNGNYGQLSIDAAGQWTYAMFPTDPHVQALAEGQRIVENFNVAAVDEHGGTTYQPLTVTLVGTNDAPVISGVTTGVVLPNAVNTAQGHLTALDPDAGDSANWSLTDGHGRYGDLVLGSDGSWTYQLDLSRPDTQSLQVGQQVSERFEVLVTDASGAKDARQVNVTVLGAQTAPTANTGHPGTSGGQGNPSNTNPHPLTGTQSGTPGPIVVPPITVSVTEDVILQQSGPIPRVAATGDHFSWQISPVTGVFGTLTLDASGRWQYQLHDTAPQVQALSAGQTAHEFFTVVGHDSHGGEVRTQVAVEVHGTDDKPIISGVDTGVAVEDVREDVSGKLAVVDVDAGDTASWQALDSQGRFGSFSVDSDGVWHYHLDPALAQGLNAGETRTEVFRVQATDMSGALSDPHEVTVQIQGTTDGPMLQGVHAGPASLAQPAVAGIMPVLDPDINDQHVFGLQSPAKGEYGKLTLAPDGHYQYQLDPASPKHIALPAGGQATDTFTIQVMDKGGHLSTGQLVVDIRGTNDAPIISGALATVVTEDSSPRSHGQLSLSDPDTGDKVTLASHDHIGQYGVFHIQDDGTWTYTLDNKNPAVQSLGAGQTLTERIPISIHDLHGLQASREMLVTIRGTNDVPVVTGDVTGAVAEDSATQRAEGHLKTTDLDTTDHTTWTAMSTPGTYGAFVLGADGGWHYQLNNTSAAVQALADGQVVSEKFIAHGTDGHGGDVTQVVEVKVTGSNDAAVITGQLTGAVTEDHAGGLHTSGKLLLSDIDSGQGHLAAQSVNGQYGKLDLHTDGTWAYAGNNADPAVQALGAGKTMTDVITVTAPDGTHKAITITFTGVNDRAVIAGVSTASVTEDVGVSAGSRIEASGQLTVNDVDNGESHFNAQNQVTRTYGAFSIDPTGHWTYTADNTQTAVQQLKAGDTLTDTFTVSSADGTSHTITVTLKGSNDVPVLTAQTQSVDEDGASLTGRMNATDLDAGDKLTFSTTAATPGFTLNGDGSYSFDPSNTAYQHLGAGQTQDVTVPITVTDSAGATSTQDLVVTVTGKNDGAVIAGTDAGVVTEDSGVAGSTIQTAGQLTITDQDAGENHFTAQSGAAGAHGAFSIDPTGHWSYTADNTQAAVQQLRVGDTLTDSFTVTSADGTRHTVTVTLKGSNDAPVLTAQTQSVNEDSARLSGRMNAADVDAGDRLTFSTPVAPPGFVLGVDGGYSFDPKNSAYQHLAAGQTQDVTIPITVTDSAGASFSQNLVITVTGKNDGAVIRGIDTGSVTEDYSVLGSKVETAGQLTVTDRDAGEDFFNAQSGSPGAHGTFSIDPTGHWTYTADNTQAAVQQLKAGDTLTDTFTVSSTDGTSHTITVTLKGSNDAPVLTAQTQSVDEDGANLIGHMNATDLDVGDKLTFSTTAATPGFTLNSDGSYSFDPSNTAYQHLGSGQTQDVTIPITVTDSAGATSTQDLIVTVTGKNDGAIIGGQTQALVTEDQSVQGGNLYASGNLTISDSDAGEASFVAQQGMQGQFGALSIDEHGAWKYVADNKQAAIQGLDAGQTLTETFTVSSIDGSQQTISITVNGTDEAILPKLGPNEQHLELTPTLSDQLGSSPVVVTIAANEDLPPILTLPVPQEVISPPLHQKGDSPVLEPPLPSMLIQPEPQPQPVAHVEEPMLKPPLPSESVQPDPQHQPQPELQPEPQPTARVDEPMLEPPLPSTLLQPDAQPEPQPQPQPVAHVAEPMLEPPLPPTLVQSEPQPQPQPVAHVAEPLLEPPLPPTLVQSEPQPQPQPTVHVAEPMLEPPLPSALLQPDAQPEPQPVAHVAEPMLEPPLPPTLIQPEPQPQPQPTVHVAEPMLEPPLPPTLIQPEPQPQPQPTVHVAEPMLEPPLPPTLIQPEPQPQPQPVAHVAEPMLEPPLPPTLVQSEPQPQPQPTVHVAEPMLEPPLPPTLIQPEPQPQPQPVAHVAEPMLEPPLPPTLIQPEPQPQPQPVAHVAEPMLEPPLPPTLIQPEPQPQPQPVAHVAEPMLEPPLPPTLIQPEPQPQPQPVVHVEEPMLEPPLPQSHLDIENPTDTSMLLHHSDTSTTPDVAAANPVDDYLQFAQASQGLGNVSVELGANNPAIDDYIQAVGVDSASVTHTTPDLPPTEILLDTEHSGAAGALPHDTSVDDAAFNTVPIDLPDLPPDDPQHHGM